MPYQQLLATPLASPLALGVIEGFFGRPWPHAMRLHYAYWLGRHGYQFFIYAPKADHYLRKNWAAPWPAEELEKLVALAKACRQNGVAFGIGLSPMGAHHDYAAKRPQLLAKLKLIEEQLAPDIIALLFDDMNGDVPDLAARQIAIAHDVAAHSRAARLIFCPSYYSTDPILAKVFGAMPPDYLTDLGQGLSQRFDIFWTGPNVCSREYPTSHLKQVAGWLKRKPFLWDNYPVNDGSKACNFLHLKAFDQPTDALLPLLAGHAVNPMKQAALSQLPLMTLPLNYHLGKIYEAKKARHTAFNALCGPQIAAMLEADLPLLHEVGLANLTAEQISGLKERYTPFRDQACVAELLGWLEGNDKFDPDCLTD
ncbi:MAG: beta-N-acetylglucosaminidase domain-containing protein [Aeromonas sp.]